MINVALVGIGNCADSDYQFVCGKNNAIDSSDKYALIVGNGEVGALSNIPTWDMVMERADPLLSKV